MRIEIYSKKSMETTVVQIDCRSDINADVLNIVSSICNIAQTCNDDMGYVLGMLDAIFDNIGVDWEYLEVEEEKHRFTF